MGVQAGICDTPGQEEQLIPDKPAALALLGTSALQEKAFAANELPGRSQAGSGSINNTRSNSRAEAYKGVEHESGVVVLHVREGSEHQALLYLLRSVSRHFRMDDALPDVPAQIASHRYVLLQQPDGDDVVDGDAATLFQGSTYPQGLLLGRIVRRQARHGQGPSRPQSRHNPDYRGKSDILLTLDPQKPDKHQTGFLSQPSDVSNSHAGQTVTWPKQPKPFDTVVKLSSNQTRAWNRISASSHLPGPPERSVLIPVALPAHSGYIQMAAEAVQAFNKRGLALTPYLDVTCRSVYSASQIQAAYRSYRCRCSLDMPSKLLMTRAARIIQRSWRAHLSRLRACMLQQIAAQAKVLDKLVVRGHLVLTVESCQRLWSCMASPVTLFPEHHINFGFGSDGRLFLTAGPELIRPGIPMWTRASQAVLRPGQVASQHGAKCQIYGQHQLLKLLCHNTTWQDATGKDIPKSNAMPIPLKDSNNEDVLLQVTFASLSEAKARAAILLALSWDPKYAAGAQLVPAHATNIAITMPSPPGSSVGGPRSTVAMRNWDAVRSQLSSSSTLFMAASETFSAHNSMEWASLTGSPRATSPQVLSRQHSRAVSRHSHRSSTHHSEYASQCDDLSRRSSPTCSRAASPANANRGEHGHDHGFEFRPVTPQEKLEIFSQQQQQQLELEYVQELMQVSGSEMLQAQGDVQTDEFLQPPEPCADPSFAPSIGSCASPQATPRGTVGRASRTGIHSVKAQPVTRATLKASKVIFGSTSAQPPPRRSSNGGNLFDRPARLSESGAPAVAASRLMHSSLSNRRHSEVGTSLPINLTNARRLSTISGMKQPLEPPARMSDSGMDTARSRLGQFALNSERISDSVGGRYARSSLDASFVNSRGESVYVAPQVKTVTGDATPRVSRLSIAKEQSRFGSSHRLQDKYLPERGTSPLGPWQDNSETHVLGMQHGSQHQSRPGVTSGSGGGAAASRTSPIQYNLAQIATPASQPRADELHSTSVWPSYGTTVDNCATDDVTHTVMQMPLPNQQEGTSHEVKARLSAALQSVTESQGNTEGMVRLVDGTSVLRPLPYEHIPNLREVQRVQKAQRLQRSMLHAGGPDTIARNMPGKPVQGALLAPATTVHVLGQHSISRHDEVQQQDDYDAAAGVIVGQQTRAEVTFIPDMLDTVQVTQAMLQREQHYCVEGQLMTMRDIMLEQKQQNCISTRMPGPVIIKHMSTGHCFAPDYIPLPPAAMANLVAEMRAVYQAAATQQVASLRQEHATVMLELEKEQQAEQQASLVRNARQHEVMKTIKTVFADEYSKTSRNRVVSLTVAKGRAQRAARERAFAQAFSRQAGMLAKHVQKGERRLVQDETMQATAYLAQTHRQQQVKRQENIAANNEDIAATNRLKASSVRNAGYTKGVHEYLEAAEELNRDMVALKRLEELERDQRVGPAGGLWGSARPREDLREPLPLHTVVSAADAQRHYARTTKRQGMQDRQRAHRSKAGAAGVNDIKSAPSSMPILPPLSRPGSKEAKNLHQLPKDRKLSANSCNSRHGERSMSATSYRSSVPDSSLSYVSCAVHPISEGDLSDYDTTPRGSVLFPDACHFGQHANYDVDDYKGRLPVMPFAKGARLLAPTKPTKPLGIVV